MYNTHCHTNGNGALFVSSADVFNNIFYWVKHPVLVDYRPAVRVTTSAANTGCFVMKRKTTKEFVEDAISVHGNAYDYSLVEYKTNETDVAITCQRHGLFRQRPAHHLSGKGCRQCGYERMSKHHAADTDYFINKSTAVHSGKYDYSKVRYKRSYKKVRIICERHGEFLQAPAEHMSGKGCPLCGNESASNTLMKDGDLFVEQAINTHGDRYDYHLVEYTGRARKVVIICRTHGEFKQTPAAHLRGQRCPTCKYSKGEEAISEFLNNHGIKYIQQKKFDTCKAKRRLPFDFYLPTLEILIEYDGEQHYRPIAFWGGQRAFLRRKKLDKLRNDWASENGYTLIRIRFDDCIEDILKALAIDAGMVEQMAVTAD